MGKAQKDNSDTPAKTGGRPTLLTDAVLEEICDRLSKGEPLAVICRDEHMPSDRTVRSWMANKEVSAAIARAREVGFDSLAAECLEIADDVTRDTKIVGDGDNLREVADTEWISRSKLRVETRLKLLAKWDPKRYGDKLDVSADVKVRERATFDPRLLSPEEREQIEAILNQAMQRQLAGPDVIEGEFREVGDGEE